MSSPHETANFPTPRRWQRTPLDDVVHGKLIDLLRWSPSTDSLAAMGAMMLRQSAGPKVFGPRPEIRKFTTYYGIAAEQWPPTEEATLMADVIHTIGWGADDLRADAALPPPARLKKLLAPTYLGVGYVMLSRETYRSKFEVGLANRETAERRFTTVRYEEFDPPQTNLSLPA